MRTVRTVRHTDQWMSFRSVTHLEYPKLVKQGSERYGISKTLPGWWLAKVVLSKPQCCWLVPYTYMAACSYLFLNMFSCWISLAQRSRTSGVKTFEFALGLRMVRDIRSVFSIAVELSEFSVLSDSPSLLTYISLWLMMLDGRLILLYIFSPDQSKLSLGALRPWSNSLLSSDCLDVQLVVYVLTGKGSPAWLSKFSSFFLSLCPMSAG